MKERMITQVIFTKIIRNKNDMSPASVVQNFIQGCQDPLQKEPPVLQVK